MRDPDRIRPVLKWIEQAWIQCPDIRLCQLLMAAAGQAGWKDPDLFYLEEPQLVQGLLKLMEQDNEDGEG